MKRKRAYRYAVTSTGGSGTKAVGKSPYILDWQHLGKTYTWHIYDFSGKEVNPVGYITGHYVDRGYLVNNQYEADAA